MDYPNAAFDMHMDDASAAGPDPLAGFYENGGVSQIDLPDKDGYA